MATLGKSRLCHESVSCVEVNYEQQRSVLAVIHQSVKCGCEFPSYESNQSSQARDELSFKIYQEVCVGPQYDFLQGGKASVHAPKSKSLCVAGNKVWIACCYVARKE